MAQAEGREMSFLEWVGAIALVWLWVWATTEDN